LSVGIIRLLALARGDFTATFLFCWVDDDRTGKSEDIAATGDVLE
jgi:hypothetical protein